ncbi:MAG: DEAD/DEAH box helicase, partial [Planctomycetota bacterium]
MTATKSPENATPQTNLNQSVQYLKGVGPKRLEMLGRLGIHTIQDMLCYFPRDYKDLTQKQKISDAKIGADITIQGRILGIQNRKSWNGKHIIEVFVTDETGTVAATWFNQPFLAGKFHVGDVLFLHGKVSEYRNLQLLNPEYEIIRNDNDLAHEGGIVPLYPLTEHISQSYLRKIMREAVTHFADHVEETLPNELLKKNRLIPVRDAIKNIHFPETFDLLENAKHRLVYDELFILEVAMALRKRGIKDETGVSFKVGKNVDSHIRNLIPFTLTRAQERVIHEIAEDMRSDRPMNRLLQGDVGSGKTVVAIYAILAAIANGYQTAFMAPTEILADQHFRTLHKYLQQSQVRKCLLTGSTNARNKKDTLQKITDGQIDLVVGTHALIENTVQFKKLGLVVIDEQHRFGVVQRMKLKEKGTSPD